MEQIFRCSECGNNWWGSRSALPSKCEKCGKAVRRTVPGTAPGGGFRHPPRTKIKVYPAEPKRRRDSVDLAGQLQQLTELWRSGALSDSEFEKAKSRLIDGGKS